MKMKRFLIVSAVVAGIGYVVCVIWTIYDYVTGGPGRWYYLIPVTMSVISCIFSLYKYLRDEKARNKEVYP